jgi:hypothetical protein
MSNLQKEKLKEYYRNELNRMFSDADLNRYFGAGKVVKYSDLANYKTINDLLPEKTDFRIILIESKINSGHWVAVLKYKNIIEFFNSYGSAPEYDFKFIPAAVKNFLGQGGRLLSSLLHTNNKDQKLYYNKKRLQANDEGVNTCGRWVTARILSMLTGYELDDFIKKCEDKKEETGKPYDILVVDWIK